MNGSDGIRVVGGERIVLAEVPPLVRKVAVAISFGTDTGPWWECLAAARECIRLVRGHVDDPGT